MRAAVRAYFRVVKERGALLGLLAGTGSPVPDLLPHGRQAPDHAIALVAHAYGVRGRRAVVYAAIVVGIAVASSDSWGRDEVSFALAQEAAERAIVGAAHAVFELH